MSAAEQVHLQLTPETAEPSPIAVAETKKSVTAVKPKPFKHPKTHREAATAGQAFSSNLTTPSSATDIDMATANYLQQQSNEALTHLSERYADNKTNYRSDSEITATPPHLTLPQTPLAERSGTLDLALDPNRIVKHVNTCYRVVKTPTQLNPDAENLGFAFKCGKTDDEKLFDAVLKNRINQHRH
ncbi:hypothetical protein JYB87_08725 [Shewanella avicenniae]|uniref:Uncharacterized protein n=1 Tax=Shewanella avicenniae TaxID=2814294 RepID=A0ABX7QX82_9GAMM|nr:hypothetical protein [Shewanella avicenniae]QSX35256.1 hypothetical protein JYB87_08725 [Shewanella avicenniae]